jgi:hypothetical protein
MMKIFLSGEFFFRTNLMGNVDLREYATQVYSTLLPSPRRPAWEFTPPPLPPIHYELRPAWLWPGLLGSTTAYPVLPDLFTTHHLWWKDMFYLTDPPAPLSRGAEKSGEGRL